MIRRSPLRRGRPKAKPSMAEFWAAVTDEGRRPCAICGRTWVRPMDPHHYVRKERLPDSAKTDSRNGVCLCRHCHEAVEQRRIECPRPPLLDQFLEDHQLLESGRPVPKGRAA